MTVLGLNAPPAAWDALERILQRHLAEAEAREQQSEAEERFEREKGEKLSREDELAKCANGAEGLLYWFDNYAWTYDPRLIADNKVPFIPFKPWKRQREFLTWLHGRVTSNKPWLLEKSRDAGATYLLCGYAIWRWLFTPGFKTTFCSMDADSVDRLGDYDSIFEKLRTMIRRLPRWMLPDGWSERSWKLMQVSNPANGALITGEAGKEAGRSGRSTLYIVDEAAHNPDAQSVESATSGNTDCIGWVSTPNPEAGGMSNFFARKRYAMRADQVYRIHWRDDPRKDQAWADEKKGSLSDPSIWESQYEISYQPATEGMAIPSKWVQAAIALLRDYGSQLVRGKKGISGGDVGAGRAKSVVVHRFTAIVLPPERRQEGDTTDTAYWMLQSCLDAGSKMLNFDLPGVGMGVQSTMNHNVRDDEAAAEGGGKQSKYVSIKRYGINTGDTPTNRVWPSEETSDEMFGNLKAELWWLARMAFQRSYMHWLFLTNTVDGEMKGREQKWDEVVGIPDDPTLQMQLSTPKWFRNEKGKIVIETKKQLAARKIASPDDADAFVLTYLESPDDSVGGVQLDVETFYQDNPFEIV